MEKIFKLAAFNKMSGQDNVKGPGHITAVIRIFVVYDGVFNVQLGRRNKISQNMMTSVLNSLLGCL